MKRQSRQARDRREIFVFTAEEKRTAAFVLIALLLGVATKHYRDAHAVPPSQIAINQTAKVAAHTPRKRAESKRFREPKSKSQF